MHGLSGLGVWPCLILADNWDVSIGATDATVFAPKFSDSSTLSPPRQIQGCHGRFLADEAAVVAATAVKFCGLL